MANQQYTVGNAARTNNNTFTIPGDEDGGQGDTSFKLDQDDAGDSMEAYIHVKNGWDTNVDVTIQGSHYLDESMSDAAADGDPVTISSGGGIDWFNVTSNYAYMELSVNPAGTPSSGDLVVTFQSREA